MQTASSINLAARPRRAGAWAGARDIAPLVVAVLPLSFAIGSAAATSGIAWPAGWLMAPLIFAGSAQLVTVHLMAEDAPAWVVIGSALVLVVRLGFYSAALASHVGSRPRHERLLMAAAVIDQLVVACTDRFSTGDLDEEERAAYFRGAAALTVSAWVAAHTVGMLIPAALPESLSLTAAAPLVYAGLLARSTRSADSSMVALASGLCAVVLVDLPAQTSVPVAVIIGMMTCGVLDRRGAGS